MDLAYYESPPGIQLLHCMEFPAAVKGGDSTFYDTFVLAELLREREPEAFATLVRVAATFQKSHAERERPAQMFYTRPHIVTDTGGAAGDVIAVFWSPPFEGPLCAPPEDVAAYYAAYDAFADLMEDEAVMAQHMVSLRLEPGDTVTFNQRRLLHVRGEFIIIIHQIALTAFLSLITDMRCTVIHREGSRSSSSTGRVDICKAAISTSMISSQGIGP